jgi:hypothetical protein
MPLRPFVAIPKDLREWTRWCEEQTTGSEGTVTLAQLADFTADRILGRLTSAGVPQELTAAQVVSLLQAVDWAFSGDVGFYGKAPITQPAHITNASIAHSLNATFDDTEVEAALNALGGKINSIIAVLETLGLKADS